MYRVDGMIIADDYRCTRDLSALATDAAGQLDVLQEESGR
jgi:hypothetical protein